MLLYVVCVVRVPCLSADVLVCVCSSYLVWVGVALLYVYLYMCLYSCVVVLYGVVLRVFVCGCCARVRLFCCISCQCVYTQIDNYTYRKSQRTHNT